MDCFDKIAIEIKRSGVTPSPDLEIVSVPKNSEPSISKVRPSVLDVELYNLKRAYDVSLELPDNVSYHHNDNLVLCNREGKDEDWIQVLHPIELCESQLIDDEEDVSSKLISDSHYKCCFCYFEGTIVQLQNHNNIYHPNDMVTKSNWCKECRVGFENKSVFEKHRLQEHLFCCPQCSKSFKRKRLLLAHLPVHSEEKCFKCPSCDKEFPIYRYLVRHLERHEKKLQTDPNKETCEQIYKCNTCQKGFTKKESLVKHKRIHTRDSLKCSLCDFTCCKKLTLKMHVISHEGNRKYKCSQCDFSFKQIGHLKRHTIRFNH